MIKKPAIPTVPSSPDKARMRFDSALKERLEITGGERSMKLSLLPADATLQQVVARINELIGLLQ